MRSRTPSLSCAAKARAWIDSTADRASDDPYTIQAVGDLVLRLHAAQALLDIAGRAVDLAVANATPGSVAEAQVAVAEAKVLSTEIGDRCDQQAVRTRWHARDAQRTQSRPALAQRAHAYPARSSSMEIRHPGKLSSERRQPAASRLELVEAGGGIRAAELDAVFWFR